MRKTFAAIAAVLALFVMTGCTSDGLSDPAYQTLRYEGGDTGGSKFKECIEPGEKLTSNDRFYPYPTTQREAIWDSKGFVDANNDGVSEGTADYPDLEVTDADGRLAYVKMKISFGLNTSCEPVKVGSKEYPGGVIQVFHETIGKTRGAYFRTDEDSNLSYGKGWIWAMTNYIGIPVEDYVGRFVRPNQVETLYKDLGKQDQLETELADNLPKLVNDVMETDLQFYDSFTVNVFKIQPEADYLALLKQREDAQIKADTAKANKDAGIAQAEADAAVARAQAEIKKAEIEGYGGFDNYRCIYLADQGLNCAQPVYYVGGAGPVKP